MEIHQPLERHWKQMDHFACLNGNFNFALVGHLLKGFRHHSPTTVARTIRNLHILLAWVGKHLNCDKFEVNTERNISGCSPSSVRGNVKALQPERQEVVAPL